jgi:hypothetical protein
MKNIKAFLLKGLLLMTMITLVHCHSKPVNKETVAQPKTGAFLEITTDITPSLHKRIAHICKIKFEHKGHGYKFTGVHSKIAIDNAHGKARIEIVTPPNAAGVYEAKVFATGPDNVEIAKSGNGGKSTFFPDQWDESRILEETAYAIKNNKGFENGIDAADGYYGYSKDGNIRIGFYYRDGVIISFFPSLKK